MNRIEMIRYCQREGIKGITRKQKKDIQLILQNLKQEKEKLTEEIKKTSNDDKDPITLEPFNEWTNIELKNSFTFNGFSYKQQTIHDYIYANTTKSSMTIKKYKDPVNSFLTIPEYIINNVKSIIHEKQIFLNKVDFTLHYTTVISQNNTYYCMFVYVNKNDFNFEICPSNLYIIKPNKQFFLGFIPTNIELDSNVMKALDTMSTTDALLCRISSLFSNLNMIDHDDKKIVLHGLKSILSTEPSALWNCSVRKKTYSNLLDEITNYE
jgi:hypothetical protein